MGQPSSIEEVPCRCGAGIIRLDVTRWRIGVLAFQTEKPAPCPACGSVEIPMEERARLRRLHGLFDASGE